jgi:hypothetical protein
LKSREPYEPGGKAHVEFSGGHMEWVYTSELDQRSSHPFKVGDRVVHRVHGPGEVTAVGVCTITYIRDKSPMFAYFGDTAEFMPEQAPFGYPDQEPKEVEAEAKAREHAVRKAAPAFSGVLAYFPDAILEIARLSRVGNEQHNAGQPMHWAKDKSRDHGDCIVRHQLDHDTEDTDGVYHDVKVAWRALAQLQTRLEKADPALAARRQAQRDRQAKGER